MNSTDQPFGDPEAAAEADSGIFGFSVASDDASIILIPVPFDATASYGIGASNGPAAILAASGQLDFFDPECGAPYRAGIAMLAESDGVRAWNESARAKVARLRALDDGPARQTLATEVNGISQQLNDWVSDKVRTWLERDRIVGTVGGDHATAYGAIAAHIERYPELGVLQIDAHADLRSAYEGLQWSHASVMRNVLDDTPLRKLVQVGLRDLAASEVELIRSSSGRIEAFFDHDLAATQLGGTPFSALVERIVSALPKQVYLSFDIDGLDPSLCPHTGTPVPGGLSFHQALAVLSGVTRSGREVVGFDLTEVAPGQDGGQWDGNVGARILYKLCGHSLVGRGTVGP